MSPDEIRAWLSRTGLSQAALARLLEPEQPSFKNTLSRWMTGEQPPRHPHILRLALAELEHRIQEGAVMQDSTPRYRIIHEQCGHEINGQSDRNTVERRNDKCPACRYPAQNEPLTYWRGATPGLDPDEMVKLIRKHGASEVAKMVAGDRVPEMMETGLDLIRWTVDLGSGVIVFWRRGDDDKPNAPVIACVNAHESRRAEFEAQVGPGDILLMTPEGQHHYTQVTVPGGPF